MRACRGLFAAPGKPMAWLSKLYVVALAIALIVLLVARPPFSAAGVALVLVTLVSLAAMAARASGISGFGGRGWWAWLVVQVAVDAVAFVAETGAIWDAVGWSWGWIAAAGAGLLFLPLHVSLLRLGRSA